MKKRVLLAIGLACFLTKIPSIGYGTCPTKKQGDSDCAKKFGKGTVAIYLTPWAFNGGHYCEASCGVINKVNGKTSNTIVGAIYVSPND